MPSRLARRLCHDNCAWFVLLDLSISSLPSLAWRPCGNIIIMTLDGIYLDFSNFICAKKHFEGPYICDHKIRTPVTTREEKTAVLREYILDLTMFFKMATKRIFFLHVKELNRKKELNSHEYIHI